MVDGLDMSLDDLIKKNKKSGGAHDGNFRAQRGRGRGRGVAGRAHNASSGPGPTRRSAFSGSFRAKPYDQPPGIRMPEAGTKLFVSNLDYAVTHEDIRILFSDVGELKQYALHYDWSGSSKGTAEVVFERYSDALRAISRYNDLRLDGRPIKIEIVGGDFVQRAMPPARDGGLGYQRGAIRSRDGFKQGGVHGQGGRGKRGWAEKVSTEALDADLEKYRQDAMLN